MNTPTIYFQTPGLIDLDVIRFMGVSVKEGDSPIGYFGTGMKYAIAVLLREKQQVVLWRGLEKYEFKIRESVIRGKAFPTIYMNEQPLGITAELGKNWQLWMAFRELWSNTKDENGVVGSGQMAEALAKPRENMTLIAVSGSAFSETYSERHKYILSEDVLSRVSEKGEYLEVIPAATDSAFYRSIRVWTPSPRKFLATYNFTNEMQLTEDRTFCNHYTAQYRIAGFYVRECKDEQMIVAAITAKSPYLEETLDYDLVAASELFLDCVERNYARAAKSARMALRQRRRDSAFKEMKLDAVQRIMVERAREFLKSMGLSPEDYKVKFSEELGGDDESSILGRAERESNTIWLSSRVFSMGTKQVASTWLEEYWHLKHHLLDYTPKMQNFLFDQIVSMGEKMNGKPL